MRGIFVTGTDTGIGKTVVSSMMMNVFRQHEEVCYWKPIQTGIEEDNDTETVRVLAGCSTEEVYDRGFRLKKPLSPHLSAKLAGVKVTTNILLDLNRVSASRIEREMQAGGNKTFWIVEGAGGVLVPLNDKELMIDLMKALDLHVVIVSRSGLGTINHTLLTIKTLRDYDLKIHGVVMNGKPNKENKRAIERHGNISVLAEMPIFEKLDTGSLTKWVSENSVSKAIFAFHSDTV